MTSNFLSVDWGNPHRGTGYKIVDEIKYVMLNLLLENINIIIALLVLGVFMAMMFND